MLRHPTFLDRGQGANGPHRELGSGKDSFQKPTHALADAKAPENPRLGPLPVGSVHGTIKLLRTRSLTVVPGQSIPSYRVLNHFVSAL